MLVVVALCVSLLALPVSADSLGLGDRLVGHIFGQYPMPRTVADALAQNWTLLNAQCDDTYGFRYRYGTRLSPTLLYDNTGVIVGMQMVVNASIFGMYPQTNLREGFAFPLDKWGEPGHNSYTLHFFDPSLMCHAPASSHTPGSIGDRLWIRTSIQDNKRPDFMVIPLTEQEMVDSLPTNGFVPSGCAKTGFAFPGSPGMGRHYWQYLRPDLPCPDAGPLFILYDEGKLVAWGFAFVGTNMVVPTTDGARPTVRNFTFPFGQRPLLQPNDPELWEFRVQPLYPYFFSPEQNPICLQHLNLFNSSNSYGDITTGTLHFFVRDPFNMTCASPVPYRNITHNCPACPTCPVTNVGVSQSFPVLILVTFFVLLLTLVVIY